MDTEAMTRHSRLWQRSAWSSAALLRHARSPKTSVKQNKFNRVIHNVLGNIENAKQAQAESLLGRKISKLINSPRRFFIDALKNMKANARARKYANKIATNGRPTVVLAGFSNWKTWIERYFPEFNFYYLGHGATFPRKRLKELDILKPKEIWIWSYKAPDFLFDYARVNSIDLRFVEDGFIRSIGLGVERTAPLSIVMDSRAMHFDRLQGSDLEDQLNNFSCRDQPELIKEAQHIYGIFEKNHISKYNQKNDEKVLPFEHYPKGILVLGQVEDDFSIKFGVDGSVTNNMLIEVASKENPNKIIYFRPHPETLRVPKSHYSNPADVVDLCEVLPKDLNLSSAFLLAEKVYTFTSLAGFEAALRGIPVRVLGAPFYAGWGFTLDEYHFERRTRKLSPLEVFAVSYLSYPLYFNPETGARINASEAIALLAEK